MTLLDRSRRRCDSRIHTLLAVVASATLFACASGRVSYEVVEAPWTGPRMTLGTLAETRTATFEVPTGGWAIHLDHTETRFGRVLAYVTLTRPGPGTMVSQAFTSHTISLDAAADQPVDVFARILEAPVSDEPDLSRVYRRVQ